MHPNVKIKRFCVVLTPTDLFCLLFPPPAYLFVLGSGPKRFTLLDRVLSKMAKIVK